MHFEYFGGVAADRYDNLKPAVIRVLRGRDRVETERFTALRSHYGFDSFLPPRVDGRSRCGGSPLPPPPSSVPAVLVWPSSTS